MSTLLVPPSPPIAPPARAPLVLRTRHQWLRWRGLLIVGIIGLSATLLALWLVPRFIQPLPVALALKIWAGGVGITALLAAIAWAFGPRSIVTTAQHLDARFAAKNRLEAAVALGDSTSPLAQAHRQEIELYLERKSDARPVRILPWLAGAAIALLLAHLLLVAVWVLPALIHPAKPKAALPPPASKDVPKAAIVWDSPGAEVKANPVEEVPTVATARSTSGLRDLTLEISVNGTPKKSITVPADPYDKPGIHKIKASLYMEDLDVQPFDVVSYYLRGQRIASQKLPDVTSSIQFVQVRPFRDDVSQDPGRSSKGYDLLIRLKLAELRSVKENFVLTHTDLPVTNPVRMQENTRVGKNQADLAAKTDEIVQEFINEGASTQMVDLLQQSKPFMEDAGKKILATQNAAALPPQQKALNLIVEVEKFFHKTMGPVSGPSSSDPNDPFRDKQKHELTKRMQAPSGQLETLVKNQTDLSQDLGKTPADGSGAPQNSTPSPGAPGSQPTPSPGSPGAPPAPSGTPANSPQTPAPQAVDPFGPDAEKGTLTERQTRILQGIGVLQNGNKVFPDAVNNALTTAQKDATAALQALHANDNAAAQEPATAAARDLQGALTVMNAAGDQDSKQALTDAQQKLNDLAGRLRALAQANPPDAAAKLMDLANQVSQVRQDLENAADHEQEAGSANDAQQLNHLAEALQEQHIASDLAAMSKSGLDQGRASVLASMLEDLAGQAAHGMTSQQATTQDYVALVNALEQTRANLAYLAQKAGQLAPGTLPPSSSTPSPGTKPGDQAQGPGTQPGQQAGATPGQGQQPGTTPGTQPGQQAGATPGQGQQPGTTPGTQPGQQAGTTPGTQPGQQAGTTPGQAQGQSPGQTPSQGQGQGQGQGTTPGMNANVTPSGQTPGNTAQNGQAGQNGQSGQNGQAGQNPQTAQGSQPGQGSPSGQNPTPGQTPGTGSGESPSTASGGTGSNPNGTSGGGGSQQTADNPGGPTSPGVSPNEANQNGPSMPSSDQPAPSASTLEAYREALDNLKNQAQQTADLAPPTSVDALQKTITRYDKDTSYRPVTPVDIVRFNTDIQKPLERLILDLEKMQAHAQRTEIVKTPDLNDTPPVYRHAVSDYFESLSRDYHPPAPQDDSKQ
jgi:hypothetical protein